MSLRSSARSYRFPLLLLVGITVGALLGVLLGEKAVVVKPLGDIFLNLMFTVVVPLVFITISSAVANLGSAGRLGRILGVMLLVFAATGIAASVVMLAATRIFPPTSGTHLIMEKAVTAERLSTASQLVAAVTVPDFNQLFSKKNMLPLILFSILFGLAVSLSGKSGRKVAAGLAALSDAAVKLVDIIMCAAPIGLGAYFAALVGEFGPQLLGNYARAMLVYYPVAIAYFFVFFTLYAWIAGKGEGVRRFWGNILTPAVTALGTGSSIATIPANLIASEKIGVPRDVRELVLPIGATIHMDGSCLSAILKIAFLSQMYGMAFTSPVDYLTAVGVALLSGMVMAGIPGGGFIGELLIVTLYNFPPEALPILAVIGTLVDPPATMLNSTGDTLTGMVIARILEGKHWMVKQFETVETT